MTGKVRSLENEFVEEKKWVLLGLILGFTISLFVIKGLELC